LCAQGEGDDEKCSVAQRAVGAVSDFLSSVPGQAIQAGAQALAKFGEILTSMVPGSGGASEALAGASFDGEQLDGGERGAALAGGVAEAAAGGGAATSGGRVVRSVAQRNSYLRGALDRLPKWMRGFINRGRVPPGHQVDHVTPLSVGGADVPANMRLRTIADHRTRHQFYRPWRR